MQKIQHSSTFILIFVFVLAQGIAAGHAHALEESMQLPGISEQERTSQLFSLALPPTRRPSYTPTLIPTNTPAPATNTPLLATGTPRPSDTPIPTTNTSLPPTSRPTDTARHPSATPPPASSLTNTPHPATDMPTATSPLTTESSPPATNIPTETQGIPNPSDTPPPIDSQESESTIAIGTASESSVPISSTQASVETALDIDGISAAESVGTQSAPAFPNPFLLLFLGFVGVFIVIVLVTYLRRRPG